MARVGLVLGAGGVTGGAFHAGVLAALHDAGGWDARDASLIVGTSAGSLTGSFLRAGIAPSDLLAGATDRSMSPFAASTLQPLQSARDQYPMVPGPRRMAMAAPTALMHAARRPWTIRAGAVAAAMLPAGSVPIAMLAEGLDPLFGAQWPAHPLWICALRLHDGRRVVFGRDGAPAARLSAAVAASCAIPSFFTPVDIDGMRYVDGGAHSPTNADVVRRELFDLVIVSSPMSYAGRRPAMTADVLARQWSRVTLDREARQLRRRKLAVVAFQPTVSDRAVMGVNPMDPERRVATAERAYESTIARLQRADVQRRLAALA